LSEKELCQGNKFVSSKGGKRMDMEKIKRVINITEVVAGTAISVMQALIVIREGKKTDKIGFTGNGK
jgi:hypothetical protein